MKPHVDIHSHSASVTDAVTLRSCRLGIEKEMPLPPFSAGIHPWDIAAAMAEPAPLFDMLKHADIAAVGETGLDYTISIDKETQKEVFAQQLDIAELRRLPVIIHCVKAYDDIVRLTAARNLKAKILHGYIGSTQQTEALLEHGFCFSFGKRSFESPKTVESLKSVPLSRLFFETDDEEISIAEIYEHAAKLLDIPLPHLREAIYNNYTYIFN